MTILEIISAIFILCPIFYAIGRHDGQSFHDKDPTICIMFIILFIGVITTTAAITLRIVGVE